MKTAIASKKTLIIINPKAGTKNLDKILKAIENHLSGKINYEILKLNSIEWTISSEIEKRLQENTIGIIIAVGGDGTVNSIASALISKTQILGIIPIGSGNGLARELRIPLKISKAFELILHGGYTEIDCCYINSIPFFCTAGIGFDAYVGKIFESSKKRGFFTYIKIVATEFLKYKPQNYRMEIDGKIINIKAFVITFANARQYGNNAIISPIAKLNDGIIEITVVKPFGFFGAITLTTRLFTKRIHNSRLVETYSGKKINIKREHDDVIHYDGESKLMGKELDITIEQKKVKIISLYTS